jgi:glycosyltransferase involved in cell wall biosynthesis
VTCIAISGASATEIADAYRAADVYLHAARADTFPTTVLEALACGTPVVATRIGGIPEQLRDGVTGWLTPPGDAAAMSEAALAILGDRGSAEAMARAARDDAEQRFDARRMVRDYVQLLAALVE